MTLIRQNLMLTPKVPPWPYNKMFLKGLLRKDQKIKVVQKNLKLRFESFKHEIAYVREGCVNFTETK